MKYRCAVCRKEPHQLPEYVEAAANYNQELLEDESQGAPISEEDFVRTEEGTFNSSNNLFVCTLCYIRVGQPSNDIPPSDSSSFHTFNNWKPSGFSYYIGKGQYLFEPKRKDEHINEP